MKTEKIKIIVLEDNQDTLDEVSEMLSNDGYSVIKSSSLAEFDEKINQIKIDLYLIDIHLPDANGINIAKSIRKKSSAGIILVSGERIDEIDRVVGLEVGADDYILKPYSYRELLARVNSVLRRTYNSHCYDTEVSSANHNTIVKFLDWKIDLSAHHIINDQNSVINLTTAEFNLLKAFLDSPNRVLTREYLLDKTHGTHANSFDRGIDGLVCRLRKKFEAKSDSAPIIKTIRSVGYMFTATVSKEDI